jgi:hypothetical protein
VSLFGRRQEPGRLPRRLLDPAPPLFLLFLQQIISGASRISAEILACARHAHQKKQRENSGDKGTASKKFSECRLRSPPAAAA